jgi:hypothetical protein
MSALSTTDTGTKVIPKWTPLNVDEKLEISLPGVMGFAEVVLKIVVTLDVLLSTTQHAEVAFTDAWKNSYESDRRTLPGDKQKRLQRLASIASKSAFGRPAAIQELEDLLKSYGLATRI